jgi:hypothetical protein
VTVALGDRVICRRNDRDVDVDNGMRGTVRHVDLAGIVIETDAHLTRDLPAGYVAEHVEHAYALTGHGMQGGTVEQAIVLAAPHDLSQGWSYTALSRARGETRLLITGREAPIRERDDIAPRMRGTQAEASEVLGQVARRMLERDDEDLAIDQLATPGRADDPQLTQPATEPLQQDAPGSTEVSRSANSRPSLSQLREQIERLRSQLQALPTVELREFDQLDATARELAERRNVLRDSLDRLPPPRERRFGRTEDPHLVDRTRLASALAGAEDRLERVLTQRATLGRQLGDATAIGEERDGLTSSLRTLERRHAEVRNEFAERDVGRRPQWMREALGERPERQSDAERWDRAARTIARYRIEYEILDNDTVLGAEPTRGDQRRAYQEAEQAREELARELSRDARVHDLGLG